MRILCVIDVIGTGGAQYQMIELALGFEERGNEVTFLTYRRSHFFVPLLEQAGICINCIEESNYILRILKMIKYIRSGNFDCVLSFLEAPNFICEVAAFPLRKWKLIVGERSANPGISKSLKLIVYRWFHFFADYIVSNSDANIQLVCKVNPFLKPAKCKVIYNIVNLHKWSLPGNFDFKKGLKLKLIVPSRHYYLKNLDGLLDALAMLKVEERNKIHIEWYGDRISEPYCDSSFPEGKLKMTKLGLNDVISFYPATDKINEIIKDADAVGLFSFYEGLPNSLCEAMACGKPIICSKVSDLPAFLKHDNKLLCNPSQIQSIKEALSYLISLDADQLKEIGTKNEKIAKEMFNRDLIISEYQELFRK